MRASRAQRLLERSLTAGLLRAIAIAAVLCAAGVVVLVLASDHAEAKAVWAIFGPAVGLNFIGTGLYAWRQRAESRIGLLMVLLGFAWFVSALETADSRPVYTFGVPLAGLWGGVFLHGAAPARTSGSSSRRSTSARCSRSCSS